MLRQFRNQQNQRQDSRNHGSQTRRISFTSLSKNKNKNIIASNVGARLRPNPGSVFHNEGKQNRQTNMGNRENNGDQYRLFSNLVKNNESRGKLLSSRINDQSPVPKQRIRSPLKCDYYGIQSPQNRMPRPESRQKIQKYFSDVPALIRSKNNNSNGNIALKRDEPSPIKKNAANCHTFPPNEYYDTWKQTPFEARTSLDDVNTSKASIKFDMSPGFNF